MSHERCPKCHQVLKRTAKQNAKYWKLLGMIAPAVRAVDEDTGELRLFSARAWHEYFKERYLGCEDLRLPSGRVLTQGRSTSDLNREEFESYYMSVEVWASIRDVYLPPMEDGDGWIGGN